MKQCFACKQWKAKADFYRDKNGSGGLSSKCKPCQSAYIKEWRAANKDYVKSEHQKYYAANKEHLAKKGKEYYEANKERLKAKSRQWHRKNRDHALAVKRLYKYNLTPGAFQYLYNKQNNVCAICGSSFKSTRDTHVDHCHKTNKVRGLLCHFCNTGLGHFRDSSKYLNNAITYLKTAPLELPSEQEQLFDDGAT